VKAAGQTFDLQSTTTAVLKDLTLCQTTSNRQLEQHHPQQQPAAAAAASGVGCMCWALGCQQHQLLAALGCCYSWLSRLLLRSLRLEDAVAEHRLGIQKV
jgi:hypothetical protein